jgi:hypothetical protein
MSNPGAFAAAAAEAQEDGDGEPPPLAGADAIVDEAYVPFFGAFGAAWDDAMVVRWSANPLGMLWPYRYPGPARRVLPAPVYPPGSRAAAASAVGAALLTGGFNVTAKTG